MSRTSVSQASKGRLHNKGRSAIAVADYMLSTNQHEYTMMHILKLVYISHGWHLALYDKPLIHDEIEAWAYGPVIPTLYRALRVHSKHRIDRLIACDTPLDDDASVAERHKFFKERFTSEERHVIDNVLKSYADYSAFDLSNITHKKDSPWAQCFDGKLFTKIPNHIIKRYYKSLLGDA